MNTPTPGAVKAAHEALRLGSWTPVEDLQPYYDELAAIIDRLAVQPAVAKLKAETDIELEAADKDRRYWRLEAEAAQARVKELEAMLDLASRQRDYYQRQVAITLDKLTEHES